MSCLGRVVTLFAVPCAVAGVSLDSEAQSIPERKNSWYFLGVEAERGGPVGDADFDDSNRRSLDDFREGERYTFSLRYSDLGTPTGQVGFGRGHDPYGAEDVLSFSLGHSFDLSDYGELGFISGIRPHVLAGLGFASGTGLDRQEEMAPALELGVGASYEVSEHWDFFTEYRAFYLRNAEQTLRGADENAGFAQNFMLGARLRF